MHNDDGRETRARCRVGQSQWEHADREGDRRMFAVHWAMTIRTDRQLPSTSRSLRRLHLGWYVLSPPSDSLDAADRIFQKRKRDAHAVSEADASESTPCPVRTLLLAVSCYTAQTDGVAQKKRRLDDIVDLTDLLQPMARTRYTNSQLGGERRKSIRRSYSDPATHFRPSSWVYQPVFHHALLTDGTNPGKRKAWPSEKEIR